jgi:hypothetical protein
MGFLIFPGGAVWSAALLEGRPENPEYPLGKRIGGVSLSDVALCSDLALSALEAFFSRRACGGGALR